MSIKRIHNRKEYRNLLLLLFLIFIETTAVRAQGREFSFNSPGSKCYFNYLSFTADSNYTLIKRPFIFILCDGSSSPTETFKRDTLRRSLAYQNYYFVYLPNKGTTSGDKLGCIEALAGMLTENFKYGKANLFFQVNDTLIGRNDITSNGLNIVFRSVRFSSEEINKPGKVNPAPNLLADFNEKAVAYKEEAKPEIDLATYYVESDNKHPDDSDSVDEKPVKTYFGPPETRNYTLTGIVRDQATGEPLPFTNIQIKGTTLGVSSNADGYFTLLKVPTDTSTLIVQYVGYVTTPVFLTPLSPKKNISIEIKPYSQTLKEVRVTAYKDDVVFVKRAEVSTIKLTPVKMAQLPSIGERDVMRSFQLMPGVSASNESSSGLYVRGGTPDQNLVLYDGFTVYHVDHLYGFFSAFNSNALKDIQLYKGGFESRFGGRISSVTEITSKEGNQKKINAGADISLLSTNVFAEIPIGNKFTSFIAFRKSYQGIMYNMIFKKFNKSSTSNAPDIGTGPGRKFSQNSQIASYFYDLNGKFTYKPTQKDIISLSLFNGTDKLDNSFSSDIPSFGQANANFSMNSVDLTRYGNVGSSLRWSRKWNSKLYGNTIISYSNYYNQRDRSQERTLINTDDISSTSMSGIFEHNDLKDFSIKSDYQLELPASTQVQFGAFATLYNVKYSYAQSDTVDILNRDGKSVLGGVYLQGRKKFFSDRLQILPGVRVDNFQATGKFYLEPRASATFNLTDRLTVRGATGRYFQFANRVTREDILSGSKEFWIISDGVSIPVTSAIHFIAGISYESDNYTFSTEAYYKKITDLTEYSLRINSSPLGVNYNENFFNGYGFSRGIEFLAQKNTGNFTGWVSYTLGEAKNHFDAYSDAYFPANQDVKHEFKIVGLYKFRRWDFSANWIYASGRPYTAPSGAYTITLLDGTTKDFFTVTDKNGVRLPAYHRFDVSATYKLLMGNREDVKRRELGTVSFSVFNLYNHLNIWYKQFTIVDGKIIENNINYLGITPNITLSLKLR
jgi:ferric enterobactin receptor